MAIELVEESISRTDEIGDDDFILAPGQTLKVETSPGGEEVLVYTAPAGDSRSVHIAVVITH